MSEIIDCHVHFDENIVSTRGFLASMDAAGIDRAALIAPLTGDFEETAMVRYGAPVLLRLLNSRSRIARRSTRRFYKRFGGDGRSAEVGGKHYEVSAQPDNDPICGAVRAHPQRFFGWVFVNPSGPVEACAELDRCLQTPGMVGAKCHPYWHCYPIEALDEAAAMCEERGVPILIHLGTGENGDYQRLPRRFPRLRVIYAHAGVPYQAAVCAFARESQNVYVDLSSPNYVGPRVTATALRLAGPDKCLFGSDGPYFHHKEDRIDFSPTQSTLESLELSPSERRRVMSETFLELVERRGST